MDLNEFLKEIVKPRKERKWIDDKTYKRMILLYRATPEVQERIRQNQSLISKDIKSKNYRRW